MPEFSRARKIASQFGDTTNSSWWLETPLGTCVLKLCDEQWVDESVFWLGMKQLFGLDLPKTLDDFHQVYELVGKLSPLVIPELLKSESSCLKGEFPGLILAQAVEGIHIEAKDIAHEMIPDLANHLAKLHQHQLTEWGTIHHRRQLANKWPIRLQATLLALAEYYPAIEKTLLQQCADAALACQAETFVPMMPDLRWDQFLQLNYQLHALVDLDAFVLAPIELDFVILEYLLNEEQVKSFLACYQQYHQVPDLSTVRRPYRLLLFMMNILGEEDIDAWMSAPTRFNQAAADYINVS